MNVPVAKTPPSAVSVFRFLDAREFLRQAYQAEKRINKGFSHRYIAKAMGAGSSSFFKDVLHARVPLNPVRAAKFAALFRLAPKEAEHFENLVLYSQAETLEERERFLKRLSSGMAPGDQSVLEASQREYLKKWHYAAVRELLAITDFRGDYEALAGLLDPPITPAEARDALQLLLRLKLIRKNAQGGFEKASKVIVTGPKNDPESAKPGLRANLELASRALEAFPPAARPFSYLTLSVSKGSLQYIHDKLRTVRQEILDYVSLDESVDRLYQLNMQLFPLSKTAKRGPS